MDRSKAVSFVCSHMLGDDCQTWKALVVLIELWHVRKQAQLKNKHSFVRVNWDNWNPELCCCYIILDWVTTVRRWHMRLTSRQALRVWVCVCVPGCGSKLRRAGLKLEPSPREDCITATQGFPTMVDHDLRLCTWVYSSALQENLQHIIYFFPSWVCSLVKCQSLAAICRTEQSWTLGLSSGASETQIGLN